MKFKKVPEELFNAVFEYMRERPFKEVARAIPALTKCETIEEQESANDNDIQRPQEPDSKREGDSREARSSKPA